MSGIKKVYWTIAEIAEMINVNASTLRFWEDEFDWLNPKRYKSGNRKYRIADIETIKSIKLLIKDLGMTLDGVRKAYDLGYNKDLELIIRNINIPVVTNSKNYTRKQVIEILCKAFEATGNEIKATMKDIRTRPHIEFNGADFDKWTESNV